MTRIKPLNQAEPRYELKYYAAAGEAFILKRRLSVLLKPDPHGARYTVNNIYFDDCRKTALFEKTSGAYYKTKIRARFYNNDLSFIRLERKTKAGDLTKKTFAQIDESLLNAFCAGNAPSVDLERAEAQNVFCVERSIKGLRPAAEFSYEREAFVCPCGSVRITFDGAVNLKTGGAFVSTRGVIEIKFCEKLPDYIKKACSGLNLIRTDNSKYQLAMEKF